MNILDDIIFDKKNKSYGAYFLRKFYFKSLCIGLSITLIIFALITAYIYVENLKNMNEYADNELQQEIVDYEQYSMLKNVDTIQINKPPIKQKIIKTLEEKLVVVDSIKPEIDTIKIVKLPDQKDDSLKNDLLANSDTSRAGSTNGTEDGTIYTKVDVLPEFPGGFGALSQYLIKNTHYPENARIKNISGIVLVEFVISKNGDVEKVAIKKGVNPLLDNEALRVIKTLPKWKPAKRKGFAVNIILVTPIKFSL